MSFKDDVITDLSTVFFSADEGSVSISYNGTTILCNVVDHDGVLQDQQAAGESTIIDVMSADVSHPVADDVVVLYGVTWSVLGIVAGGPHAGYWRIDLTRATRRRV